MPTSRPVNAYTKRLVGVGLLKGGEISCVANGVVKKMPIHEINSDGIANKRYLTVSRNGEDPVTLTFGGILDIDSPDEQLIRKLMMFGQDGTSIAFFDSSFMMVSNNSQNPVLNNDGFTITELRVNGEVDINGTRVDLSSNSINVFPEGSYQAPHKIRSEENSLTFMPTPSVAPDLDDYYLFDGSDMQDSITIYSCAVLELGEEIMRPM